MTVKILGKRNRPHRIITNIWSLDRAFVNEDGDIGLPIGIGYELYGLTHVGKSTFVYSLASIIGREVPGDIGLCDFEGFDDTFLSQVATTNGFDGNIYVINEEQDEDQLDSLDVHLDKKCVVGILDSIGAIAPMGETKGDIGEANMGRRALLMAQFSRKVLKIFRFQKYKTVLMTNHWYPKIGGYGYDTPGGEAKKYIASVRIKLSRDKVVFPDNSSYALIGEVTKNRWGFEGRKFYVFILGGYGLHVGMSALWNCIKLKLVKPTKSGLSLEGEKIGKLGHFAKAAKEGKNEVFEPFFKLLEGYNGQDEAEDIANGGDEIEDPLSDTDEVVED